MSTVSEALKAVREALLLADKVKRTADATLELTKEARDQDRRITRLEAQWDTAMQFSTGTSRKIEGPRESIETLAPGPRRASRPAEVGHKLSVAR